MIRAAIIVLVLVIILTAYYLPRFRRSLGILLLFLTVAIAGIIWQDSRERKMEFQRVSKENVQLLNMEIRSGLNARSFVISGRVQNADQDYTILGVTLQARLKDCVSETCKIVGQEQSEVPLEIPAGQARDFTVTMPFPNTPKLQGEERWEYEVLQVRAR